MNRNARVSHSGCRLDRKTPVREAGISVHEKKQKYPFAPLAKHQVDPSREHPENFCQCCNSLKPKDNRSGYTPISRIRITKPIA